MRLLLILAVVFLAIALVCSLVPTALFTIGAQGWLIMGLLSWALDQLVGGELVTFTRRP